MDVAVNNHFSDSTVPRSLNPIIGRGQELDRLLELLDDPGTRLVTITGPGGTGKSRLALELAATLADEFEREVVFVPLAAIREPDLVLPEIARTLGTPPAAGPGIVDVLVQTLRDRELLLVLDNMEQILPAGVHLAGVLARCPAVRAVVTSRAALGVSGEHRLPLAPLPLASGLETDAAGMLESPAVKLFVARARAIRPSLSLDDETVAAIAEICRQVDGLPLAIELAAARLNVLSPQALLARLGNRLQILGSGGKDAPNRLKTMRQAIAWSYDLLAVPEQSLFRRLSVFAGGFSLDAAATVAEGTGHSTIALDTLGALVDHSLVNEQPRIEEEPRYAMLETLREFGIELLEVHDETAGAHDALARICIDLAERAEPHLAGANQAMWLRRLDADWDNIRNACIRANDTNDPSVTLRLMAATFQFVAARGHTTVARGLLDEALAATRGQATRERCRALFAAGTFAEDQRDLAQARTLLDEAQDLATWLGDTATRIQILISLSHEAHDRGDYEEAIGAITEAIELATGLGDRRRLASALGAMGNIRYFQGNLDDAERSWEQARLILAQLGDRRGEATILGNLGAIASGRQDYRRAIELQERALTLTREMGDEPGTAHSLINLAENLRFLGDLERAEALVVEGTGILRDLALKGVEAQALHIHASIGLAQGNHQQALVLQRQSQNVFIATGDLRNLTDSATLLAGICLAYAMPRPAIELLAGASAQRERLGIEMSPIQTQEMTGLTARLRRMVRDAGYDRAWQAGLRLEPGELSRRMVEIGASLSDGPAAIEQVPAPPPDPIDTLSTREREVMHLLVAGQSSRAIGDALSISPRTATTHINNIYVKLGVNNRAQAVALAVRAGLDPQATGASG